MAAKPPIPARFLSRKGSRFRNINFLNLAVLLLNAQKAAKDPEIGWGDVKESFDSALGKMNRFMFIMPDMLESLLWSSNMLDEKGEFVDPKGRTFDQFVKEIVRKDTFDKTYNYIKNEEEDDKRSDRTNYGTEGRPADAIEGRSDSVPNPDGDEVG